MGGGRGGCGVVCGVQVVPDGPADHAVPRMEKGDIVKLIDGVNVSSLAHAKSLILGEPGTQVGMPPLLCPSSMSLCSSVFWSCAIWACAICSCCVLALVVWLCALNLLASTWNSATSLR